MHGPMIRKTQHLLRCRPRNLHLMKIAKDTGLNIQWLHQFSQDKNNDYGVNKVETLYTYLTKTPLALD